MSQQIELNEPDRPDAIPIEMDVKFLVEPDEIQIVQLVRVPISMAHEVQAHRLADRFEERPERLAAALAKALRMRAAE